MKHKRKISLVLLLVFVLSFAMSTTALAAKISTKKITVVTYAPRRLKITGTNKKVTWKVSNSKTLKVSAKGYLTGKKKGTSVVTAIVGKQKFKCKVTILNTNDVKKLFKKKVLTKIKRKNAHIVDWYRSGTYVDVMVGVPSGDGVLGVNYRVNLKTGYAFIPDQYYYNSYRNIVPKKVKLF